MLKKILVISISINILFGLLIIYKIFDRYQNSFSLRDVTNGSYWKDKISQYSLLNEAQRNNIFFVGDSLVDRFCLTEFLPEKKIFNRGIGWDHTTALLSRLEETVLNGKPRKIILYIGGNDISQNDPKVDILDNYSKIIRKIKQHNIELVAISILPRGDDYEPKQVDNITFNKVIQYFNTKLSKLCKKEKVDFLDIHFKFADVNGYLKKGLTNDGTHLNAKGYVLLTRELAKYL